MRKIIKKNKPSNYSSLVKDISSILESARRTSARVINTVITATYWEIGRRINEYEYQGRERVEYYGDRLLESLAKDLTMKFGRGFSRPNLQQMKQFYLINPYEKICQTLSNKSPKEPPQFALSKISLQTFSHVFPLPWSHYVRLFKVKDEKARDFYEAEALHNGWSVRQLDRQISSLFYERILLTKNKADMLRNGAKPKPEDVTTPDEEIKDPFILEFLDLKDEYSESQLEEALIEHLEKFLLELGGDFAFIGRQKRLRIGAEWYRIDLLFFHRKLKCLVVIDLKVGKFTHADAGQMHLYLNYAREHWTNKDENPPVGLILCAEKDNTIAKYALEGLKNKILAAEYKLNLPDEKLLAKELADTKKILSSRFIKGR